MKYVLLDLALDTGSVFPTPHKAIYPIFGVLYQEIDGDSSNMGYITLPNKELITNYVKPQIVNTEHDLIRALQSVIGGYPEILGDGAFVVDWTGYDYQYLLGRSCVLDLHMPNACGHMSLSPLLKKRNQHKSLSAKNLYEEVNSVAPLGDFYEFKFNVMSKLLRDLPKEFSGE